MVRLFLADIRIQSLIITGWQKYIFFDILIAVTDYLIDDFIGERAMAEKDAMSLINSHIEKSEFSQIYLLGGSEKYLLSQYKDKLIKALIDPSDTMNYVVYKGENAKVEPIVDFSMTMPFFADRRVLLVEDSDFFKKGNDDIDELVGQLPESTVIVFTETNIDKRCKLYKTVSKLGTVALFETPDERTLLVWLKALFSKENIKIDDNAVYRLLEGVGMDMTTLYNEAEKLKSYCFEKGIVTTEDVEALSINQIEGKIFDMMDALSKKDKKTTLDLYSDLLMLREPAMRLLYLITRQFNILLKTKIALESGKDNSQIAATVKIPPFTVKKYIAQCNGYSKSELLERVNWCQEADSAIKTGAMKDNMSVEMLIIKLLQ